MPFSLPATDLAKEGCDLRIYLPTAAGGQRIRPSRLRGRRVVGDRACALLRTDRVRFVGREDGGGRTATGRWLEWAGQWQSVIVGTGVVSAARRAVTAA